MAPTMTIQDKREKREALIKRGNELFNAADSEQRTLSEAEWSEWQQARKELDDLGTEIAAEEKRAKEEAEARAQIRQLSASMGVEQKRVEDGLATGIGRGRSIGEVFANSPQMKQFLAQFPGGRMPDSYKRFQTPPVALPMGPEQLKALMVGATLLTGDSATSAGAFVVSDRKDIYVPVAQRPLTLIDLVDMQTTESDTVEYVRQTSRTNSAAPVAEATTAAAISDEVTTAAGGVKPESAMAFAVITEAVKTLAHWIPATKRALSDVGQLRGLIDSELRYGLNEEFEDQLMNGDGQAPNFTGVFNASNIQTQAYTTDLFTTTRKAVTKMQTVALEEPTGWVFNASDWEAFELLKDGENRYYFGGPFATGPRTLWGYPPTICHAMLAGHSILANWMRVKVWMREGINITATDSHDDFFIRNLVAILAEFRAAFGITKPSAIVKLSLNSAS